jgi:cytochrome P450
MPVRFPPGPANYNFWCGGTWRHAWRLWADPLAFSTHMARRYGDVVFYRLFYYAAYQINRPDLVREVLVTKANSFVKERRVMGVIRDTAGESVLTTEGPTWQRLRRMLLPAFQSSGGHRLAEIGVRCVGEMAAHWQDGQTLAVHSAMTDLMLRTAGEALLGLRDQSLIANVADAMSRYSLAATDQITSVVRLPGWLPGSSQSQIDRARRQIEPIVEAAIRQRRERPAATRDLLDLLLEAVDDAGDGRGLSDRQARAEAVSMYFAGHHTAAATLTWTLYLLSQNPEVEQRLFAEIDGVLGDRTPTPADLGHLPYTEQVLKESMRIYPPAWNLFLREAVEPVEIGGWPIPRGAWVFIFPWVLHHDERWFPDPWRCDPDRFTPVRAEAIPSGAYVPFGLGGHACLGGRMALAALHLMLPAILQRFRFTLAPGQGAPVPEPLISIRPKGDVRMIATERKRS